MDLFGQVQALRGKRISGIFLNTTLSCVMSCCGIVQRNTGFLAVAMWGCGFQFVPDQGTKLPTRYLMHVLHPPPPMPETAEQEVRAHDDTESHTDRMSSRTTGNNLLMNLPQENGLYCTLHDMLFEPIWCTCCCLLNSQDPWQMFLHSRVSCCGHKMDCVVSSPTKWPDSYQLGCKIDWDIVVVLLLFCFLLFSNNLMLSQRIAHPRQLLAMQVIKEGVSPIWGKFSGSKLLTTSDLHHCGCARNLWKARALCYRIPIRFSAG